MSRRKVFGFPIVLVALFLFVAASDDTCNESKATHADRAQADRQLSLIAEANAQTGMPAIKNFRERKLLKDILELRDQDGLVTYTYTFSEMTGKYAFFCDSVGYGIPYATQYTNPMHTISDYSQSNTIPQADPNGLFSPADAEGTWVMCKNPNGEAVRPIYIEPRVIVSPFKLSNQQDGSAR